MVIKRQNFSKPLFKIFSLLTLLAVVLVLAELLLRLFWYSPYLDPNFKRDDPKWLEKDVVLDHFGYRDREFSLTKDPTVFRIYSLGTSYTFGWYLKDPALSYPKQLENNLQQNFPDQKIEVINAAHPGFSLSDKISRFKTQGVLFAPDLVTVDLSIYDLNDKVFPPRYINNHFIRNLRIYQLTLGSWQRQSAEQKTTRSIEDSLNDPKSVQKLTDQLLELKNLTASSGANLAVILIPEYDPQNPNAPYRYQKFDDLVKNIAREHSTALVDLLTGFNAIGNKKELVLNPTDPHLSVFGNQLTGGIIAQTIDFKKLFSAPRDVLQTQKITASTGLKLPNFKNIVSITPAGWLYFDRSFALNSMPLFLPDNSDKKLVFIEDQLETAKSFTHKGWPGAKLEYRLPAGEKLVIKKTTYGYPVVGVAGVMGFWEEDGALQSEKLNLTDLKISKDEQNIYIVVKNASKYQMYKVTVDLAIKQLDLDEGMVASMFETKLFNQDLKNSQTRVVINSTAKIGSTPRFVSENESIPYIWLDDNLQPAVFKEADNTLEVSITQNGSKIEIPLAVEYKDQTALPTIEYASYP